MSVDELITEVLNLVRNHFYADRVREFKRDERALMKAILRYGYECNQRGWQFDVPFIFRELSELLQKIRTGNADIQYLPIYLDGAIKRHIGLRAEELSAKAKSLPINTARLVAGLKTVEAVRETSAVEICAAVFKELGRARRRQTKPPAVKQKQTDLL